MSDDYGLLDKDGDAAACCPECDWELEWEDCDMCGGEGEFDWETLQDEDPLWYQPGDTEPCSQCSGAGGWYSCPQCTKELFI